MARRTERRSLWGVDPDSLHTALDAQQNEARHRIQALQSELDAERAEQERLEAELRAGRERLDGKRAELAATAESAAQRRAELALAAGVMEQAGARARSAAAERLRVLRIEEVLLLVDLAEARRALRETLDALKAALPAPEEQ